MHKGKKLAEVLHADRQLLAIFSGMVLSAIFFVSLAATAGIWYF